jgi:hypothetical protein
MELSATEIVERLIEAFDAKNAAEMARKIGTSSAIVTAWRKRNTIPYKEV